MYVIGADWPIICTAALQVCILAGNSGELYQWSKCEHLLGFPTALSLYGLGAVSAGRLQLNGWVASEVTLQGSCCGLG